MAELEVNASDIMEVNVLSELGKITEWVVRLRNVNDTYTNEFTIGDDVEIQLGWEVPTTVVRGYVYHVERLENDTIEIRGFDWKDYLAGPIVSKSYYNEDWGYILKDLIQSYAPALDASQIQNIGETTGGLLEYYNVTLWDVIQDIESKTDRVVKVGPDRVVYFEPESTWAKYTISDVDTEQVSIKNSATSVVNKVIVIGEKERIWDSFMEATIRSEYWSIQSGNWETTPTLDLKHSGSQNGLIFTAIKSYASTVTTPVKQSIEPYEVSIYARTNDSLSEGYRLRLWNDGTNYLLSLYKEPNDVHLASYTLNSDEVGKIQNKDYIILKFSLNKEVIKGYIGEIERISVSDWTWESGKVGFLAPANRDTYFDYIRIDTDTPLYAIAEDSESISKYGEKAVVIKRPEIGLKTQIEAIANAELIKRKYSVTSGSLIVEGEPSIELNDLLKLYITSPYIDGTEYRVIGIEHHYDDTGYYTTCKLQESIPALEAVLKYLTTEQLKKVSELTIPKSVQVEDILPLLSGDSIIVWTEDSRIGHNRLGYAKVSNYGSA